ncbi:hypothetical protein HPB47_001050, partial [Ixodes persulcatus]
MNIHGQLKETDAAIEPSLTGREVEQEFQRIIECDDQVALYSARLSIKVSITSEGATM